MAGKLRCATLLVGVVHVVGATRGWMGRWMDMWIDGWINSWMDGWVDGWVYGWMDRFYWPYRPALDYIFKRNNTGPRP